MPPHALGLATTRSATPDLLRTFDADWARRVAIGLDAVVTVPLLGPVVLILVAELVSWLTGKPVQWN